jgi:hypothetical protein
MCSMLMILTKRFDGLISIRSECKLRLLLALNHHLTTFFFNSQTLATWESPSLIAQRPSSPQTVQIPSYALILRRRVPAPTRRHAIRRLITHLSVSIPLIRSPSTYQYLLRITNPPRQVPRIPIRLHNLRRELNPEPKHRHISHPPPQTTSTLSGAISGSRSKQFCTTGNSAFSTAR